MILMNGFKVAKQIKKIKNSLTEEEKRKILERLKEKKDGKKISIGCE